MPGRLLSPANTNPHLQQQHNGAGSDDDDDEEEHEGSGTGSDPSQNGSNGADTPDEGMDELSDGEFPSMFREVGGRLYHSSPSAPYALPVDAPEQQRCTIIHSFLRALLGAHFVGPVPEVLQDDGTRRRIALDICTGRGDWMIDMVREFPHVRFRGFDIVPIGTRYPPRNVQFEIYDLHEPFRWEDGTFDLVNARFIAMTTRNYPWVLGEISRVLRPGGLFVSYEWDMYPLFDPTNGALAERDLSSDFPAVFRLHHAVDEALALLHVPPIAGLVPQLLHRTGSFDAITPEVVYVPIGIWHQDEEMRDIGEACLEAHRRYARSVRALLIQELCTEAQADSIISGYEHELTASRGLVAVLHTVHARRGVA